MANTINTRILLRNDTLTNWESSDLLIYKGEAALAVIGSADVAEGGAYEGKSDYVGKYELRIGTSASGSTWSDLGSSNIVVPAGNVEGLLESLYTWQLTESAGTWKLQKKLSTDSNWTDVSTVTLGFADGVAAAGYNASTNPIALKAYVDEKSANATAAVYVGVRATASTTDADAITAILNGATPKGGDICIVKTALAGTSTKYSYKAFVYDATTDSAHPEWQAMDGNYDWNSVYATEDLTVTQAVGTITIPSSGSTTFAVQGKTVKQVFEKLLAQEKCPGVTQPTVSVTLTNSGAKEVGTSIAPAWKTTFTAGSYTYGPATGVTAKASTVYHDSVSDSDADAVSAGSLNNATGTLDSITVTSSTNYKAKLNYGWTQGAIPLTNLGNDATQENDSGETVSRIAEVSNQTATSSNAITGYVMGKFYGTSTSVIEASAVTSADVRALANKSNNGTSTGTVNMTVPVGAKTIIIAAAGTRTLTQVLNTTVNADMTESFVKNASVSVCGADAPSTSNANNYTVWTYSPAEAYASTAALTIKIA